MSRFTIPRDIYFGSNAIGHLSCLKGYKRAFIVIGGNSVKKNGYLKRLYNILDQLSIATHLFEGVENDPGINTVLRGAEEMRQFEPDVILAMGGGSPMDAAKAMWIFYENPDLDFQDILTPFTLPKLRRKAVFVAIATTSGSASEVTAFSVITGPGNDIKYPLADFEITPDIAVIDTKLPQSMPRELCAHTGMDALTHAIEAYCATNHSDFTDPLALHAIQMIWNDLPHSYQGNKKSREKMHIAQCLAGMAFSNALLGIVHALAHKSAPIFNLSHGLCNAILLPYVMQYNADACADRYAAVAFRIGLRGGSDAQLTDALIKNIFSLNAKLNLPPSFQAAGIAEDVFQNHLHQICQDAYLDPCTGSNPRKTSPEDLASVLQNAYYGKKNNQD